MQRILFASIVMAMLTVLAGCRSDDAAIPRGTKLVEDLALSEMSGLIASRRDSGVYWSINDSGSLPRLFRMGESGQAMGRVWVAGAWLRDSESMAHWHDGSQHWLLIGDVGDNRGVRDTVAIHALAEPENKHRFARIAWSINFSYPDGSRDSEGIAVDQASGDVLVLSKRDLSPRLYRVPLSARGSKQVVIADFLGAIPPGVLDAQVTGLDLSDDGQHLAVLTYRSLYQWQRKTKNQAWAEVLVTAPCRQVLPKLRKAEAMAFSPLSHDVLVGSERQPTPLWTTFGVANTASSIEICDTTKPACCAG